MMPSIACGLDPLKQRVLMAEYPLNSKKRRMAALKYRKPGRDLILVGVIPERNHAHRHHRIGLHAGQTGQSLLLGH